jgi:hypothetical protein
MELRPPRALLWCTVVVVLVHLWALQRLPEWMRSGAGSLIDAPGAPRQPVLSLRRIEATPALTTSTPSAPSAPSKGPASSAPSARATPSSPSPPSPPSRADTPDRTGPRVEGASIDAASVATVPAASSADVASTARPPTTPTSTAPISAAGADSAADAAPHTTPAPAALPAPAAAASVAGSAIGPLAIPGSTRLRYIVRGESRGRPYQVNASLSWQHDGQQYDARLEVSAWLLGARTQTSRGRITGDGIAPLRFGDRYRSEQAAHFQRDKGVISFSSNAPDAPLRPGAQDRLSVLLQLGAMIGGDGQRYPAGTQIQIQTAGTREADLWSFRVVGTESLQLPGGPIQALKLERLPRRDYDQHIEVWLAPTLDHLPARVRITQGNGDVVDQQWLSRDSP